MVVYMLASAGLVCYNKYLMDAHRFPFPAVVVLIQMIICSGLSGLFYLLLPGRFPAIERLGPSTLLLKSCMPISLFFMMELMLGTAAMMTASVAFLQMVKESGVAWVYFLSLLVSVETFCWRKFAILVFTLAGTVLTIRGEPHFAIVGFLLQGAAVLCASCKAVLQQLVLQSRGMKLDPLSYVLVMSPISATFLASMLVTSHYLGRGLPAHKGDLLSLPSTHVLVYWAPYLLCNSIFAFLMNVLIALVMKTTSAISVTLLGLVKDAFIVFGGVIFAESKLSGMQGVGFALQLAGVLLWSTCSLLKEEPPEISSTNPSLEEATGGLERKLRAKGFDSYGASDLRQSPKS
jgi:hypothetical protein